MTEKDLQQLGIPKLKVKKSKPPVSKEKHFQTACENYLQYKGLWYVHIESCIHRVTKCPFCYRISHHSFPVEGNKGCWDFVIAFPSGLIMVELKVGYNKLTDEQKELQTKLESYGYIKFIELHDEKDNDLFDKFKNLVDSSLAVKK